MGAVLWIPLMALVLLGVGFLLWTLLSAGRGAAAAAKSVGGESSGETAAHTDERTKARHVDTTPPEQPER